MKSAFYEKKILAVDVMSVSVCDERGRVGGKKPMDEDVKKEPDKESESEKMWKSITFLNKGCSYSYFNPPFFMQVWFTMLRCFTAKMFWYLLFVVVLLTLLWVMKVNSLKLHLTKVYCTFRC